jgi:uncharacterized membrane protein
MSIGPVQLISLGFNHPHFTGEIKAELDRLREKDTIRVIDALGMHKDAEGNVTIIHASNLTHDEQIELGATIGALLGLGMAGEEGIEAGATIGAQAAAETGMEFFSDEQAWDVIGEIPNDAAALLLLIEHQWAVPLRDAIAAAGGFRISDGFISPFDLVAVGLVTAEEAREMHEAESRNEPAAA